MLENRQDVLLSQEELLEREGSGWQEQQALSHLGVGSESWWVVPWQLENQPQEYFRQRNGRCWNGSDGLPPKKLVEHLSRAVLMIHPVPTAHTWGDHSTAKRQEHCHRDRVSVPGAG